MSNLANPLQQLIDQAKQLENSGQLDRYAERVSANPIGGSVVIIDTSGSMEEVGHGRMRKIDILREAVDRPLHPGEVVIAFSSTCKILPDLQSIPESGGGTALHMALERAIEFSPKSTLVVCDGKPNSKSEAFAVAGRLPGIINTLYIGPDDDLDAIQFMADLARVGCGIPQRCDVRFQNPKQLGEAITRLLPG